jgi:hypothetical protein
MPDGSNTLATSGSASCAASVALFTLGDRRRKTRHACAASGVELEIALLLALIDLDQGVEHLQRLLARTLEGVAADDRAVAAAVADGARFVEDASSPLAAPPEKTTMRRPLKQLCTTWAMRSFSEPMAIFSFS